MADVSFWFMGDIMKTYAVVKSGTVTNVVAWDGMTSWSPPEGAQAIETEEAGIGWLYDGTAFQRPAEPPQEPA
jgi:hypothetical protein